jgi:hypothetical protein
MPCVYPKRAPIANLDDRLVKAAILVASECSILPAFWKERHIHIPTGGRMPHSLARWEARRHIVEATILVASQCSILAAFWKE